MDLILLFSIIFYFILGICIGSFINAFEYRMRHKMDFVSKRSMCPHCKHELSALDLVPIFSYLFLQGRCRYCKRKISIQYPIVEFITGAAFAFTSWFYFNDNELLTLGSYYVYLLKTLVISLLLAVLVFISVYDFKYRVILDKVVLPLIALFIIINAVLWLGRFSLSFGLPGHGLNSLIAGFAGFTFFFLIAVVTRGKGMGGGDIKLGALLGLLLGGKGLVVALYLGFITGALWGIGGAIAAGKLKGRKMALGPFLCLGGAIAIFYSEVIFNWFFPNIELLFEGPWL